jgi:hypothetical protein
MLRQINPDFFFPYWDSPKQWANADDAPVWKYLGGLGEKVPNDIFKGVAFNLTTEGSPKMALSRPTASLNKRLVQASNYDKITKDSMESKNAFSEWTDEVFVCFFN